MTIMVFEVLYQNVRGLRIKTHAAFNSLSLLSVEMVFITESW